MPDANPALSSARLDALEVEIYERSKALALAATIDDYLEDQEGTYWIVASTAGKAKAFFAGEYGCDFRDVRCRRTYNAVDLHAIRDQAHDIVNDLRQGYGDDLASLEGYIAYTWEDYGWLWTTVPKGHPRAIGLWECRERVA